MSENTEAKILENEVRDRLTTIAEIRLELETLAERKKSMLEFVTKNPVYVEVETMLKMHNTELEEHIKFVKEKAVLNYKDTQEKKYVEGLSVKLFSVLEYDKKIAWQYVLDRPDYHGLLILDEKKFEALVKALGKMAPKFVSSFEVARGEIASDLSKYLETE